MSAIIGRISTDVNNKANKADLTKVSDAVDQLKNALNTSIKNLGDQINNKASTNDLKVLGDRIEKSITDLGKRITPPPASVTPVAPTAPPAPAVSPAPSLTVPPPAPPTPAQPQPATLPANPVTTSPATPPPSPAPVVSPTAIPQVATQQAPVIRKWSQSVALVAIFTLGLVLGLISLIGLIFFVLRGQDIADSKADAAAATERSAFLNKELSQAKLRASELEWSWRGAPNTPPVYIVVPATQTPTTTMTNVVVTNTTSLVVTNTVTITNVTSVPQQPVPVQEAPAPQVNYAPWAYHAVPQIHVVTPPINPYGSPIGGYYSYPPPR